MSKTAKLGERIDISELVGQPSTKKDWITIDNGNHQGAAIAVWCMEEDEASPACEEFARRLVAAHNAADGISTDDLEKGTISETHAFPVIRRLMDENELLNACQDAERTWEVAMMRAVGEDGVGDVVTAINSLKLQRDTAWRELAEIRKAINANPEESTLDEVKCQSSLFDIAYELLAQSQETIGGVWRVRRDALVGKIAARIVKMHGVAS